MIDLKSAINSKCFLSHFSNGDLWYRVGKSETGPMFPVPVEDVHTEELNQVMDGADLFYFMKRWNNIKGKE